MLFLAKPKSQLAIFTNCRLTLSLKVFLSGCFGGVAVGVGCTPILRQRTKFRKYRSNRYRDIAIFVIFKMTAAAILNFQKFEILTVDLL